MTLHNDLLIRAAKGEKVERVPVWLMRQAGRILPEYRKVRNSVSGFIELAKTPELAAEVTIQPVDLLGVDAAIIFSDILVIPEAMGLPYQMIEKQGPWFENTIQSAKDLSKVRIASPEEDLSYVLDAIKIAKKELNGRVPLIGFAGAPWTIFSYMVEGAGSKTFSKAKKMLYAEPELSHQLLDMITDSTILYLKAQIKAGADLIQIFDSWAGILSPDQYDTFGLKYISKICDAIDEVPITVFAKGAFFARKRMSELKCETIGLDWNMSISASRRLIGDNKTLQGNLDPCVLYSSDQEIEKHTIQMLEDFGGHRHIANLGHGVYPDISPEKVKVFIETVKNWRAS
ncbi:uroporphyrinogen decarboxylase [Reichenbachiella agariperforans]|uniref:uroporphyrinogen decarboxylase n=1 Tax=Reichenbachiella agariperforans TaxID=156994 RepID=UPI001C08F495|nr:uroporphyrinogen decarboxylase [Reichenbachiella agariperforans]MBU2913905.1 uroporphyrinogen decarboxylase [Reichenbachiella agariperforans]